ncbi:MAG: long-chain-fatty-acid--CoA ligase [Rhodobacteraceae bacterium]|nr:long-chain-fatty-acid--CoA ligase [Paracoccaceae bacterium]
MKGLMMNRPLSVSSIIDFAAETHGDAMVTSSTVEGGLHRMSYRAARGRIAQLAHALRGLGVQPGDRVATLAWNGYRHFELYYATAGIGAVCHTINPRLFEDQLLYIVAHAQDRVIFFDATFAPLLAKLRDRLPRDLKFVAMTDRAHMPDADLPELLCYEELLDGQPDTIDWPELPEDAACSLCYTSGTTGEPKGALYSHRSTVLHALTVAVTMQDSMRSDRKVLPVVPLFHVNAWGLPYTSPLTGTGLVFPGPKLDGASLFELMEAEKVFSSWGVPTVWLGLLAEMRARGRAPEGLSEVVIGGSAASRPMIEAFEKEFGVGVCHAWGMTEMSPIGTCGLLSPTQQQLPVDAQIDIKCSQGKRVFGVDFKLVDDAGSRLPHDGQAAGELYVRGNTIISGYFENDGATQKAIDGDGWFGTGDIASVDPGGFLRVSDRSKDLIKSGGEWISSIDLESIASGHPGVANCAVIAKPDEKWGERPLLIVVASEGHTPSKEELLAHVGAHVAKWQAPDDVLFVEALPLTATGKVSKMTLRRKYVAA